MGSNYGVAGSCWRGVRQVEGCARLKVQGRVGEEGREEEVQLQCGLWAMEKKKKEKRKKERRMGLGLWAGKQKRKKTKKKRWAWA